MEADELDALPLLLEVVIDEPVEELVLPLQPTPVGSHLQGTQAEPDPPLGSTTQPAPVPQLVIAVQPIWVQNHSLWPTSARQSGACAKALHSPPPGVQ